jgi:hypothetical protein
MKFLSPIVFGLVAIFGALASCSPSQNASIISGANMACHVVTAAELADPVFVSHNPNLIANQTLICTGLAAPLPPQ